MKEYFKNVDKKYIISAFFQGMNMQGIVRMDFLVAENKAYLCEVNTVPGSLAYYLFCERLIDARRFISDILEEAIKAHAREKKGILALDILQSVNGAIKK